jgi:EAL domain-containing protein (putative c-di-GMP-specific phosphodiesterase class I)
MVVVAEGVETEEQLSILREMNCQFGQGYLFSKPLNKSNADQLIENIIKLSKENPDANFSLPAMLSN